MQFGEDFAKLRDSGRLLSPTKETTGIAVPLGYKLIRCNMDTVVTAEWDPIGTWEPMPNQVLRLTSKECRLTLYKMNGMKIDIEFQQGDFRHQVDNWLVMYAKSKMKVDKIF